MKFNIILISLVTGYFSCASQFSSFLQSLDDNLPIDSSFMQQMIDANRVRLAHPSLLEKWGVINQEAAATYNGILNTVVLKPEYTTDEFLSIKEKRFRVKVWNELKFSEPTLWQARVATIFHELSHAEFKWLNYSPHEVDQNLLRFLKTDFDRYLKNHYPNLSAYDRRIARSEQLAYFRGEVISLIVSNLQEGMMLNGYSDYNKKCRLSPSLKRWLEAHPEYDSNKFVLVQSDFDFTDMELPTIFVKGREITIDRQDIIYEKLKSILWAQFMFHFSPAKSKSDVIIWMNKQHNLLSLIEPCRK